MTRATPARAVQARSELNPLRALALSLLVATTLAPASAQAVVTFALEVGGSSTIAAPAPGSTVTADLVLEIPSGDTVSSYGINVDLGPNFGGFSSGSNTPPPPLFGPPFPIGPAGGSEVGNWIGSALFGGLSGPVDVVIGTVTFTYAGDVGGTIATPLFMPVGPDTPPQPAATFRALTIVPEPSTALLVAFGLAGLARRQRA